MCKSEGGDSRLTAAPHSKAFPQLPRPGFALSAAEAAALQAQAARLHISIVAEVDLPGHSTGLLKAIPALAARSLKTGKPCSQINVTDLAALEIMETLLGEIMELFPGPWHHLGCDEVSMHWQLHCAAPAKAWTTSSGHRQQKPTEHWQSTA